MLARILLLVLLYSHTALSKDDDSTVPAVRVVRIQVEYPNATVKDIPKIHKPANDCGKAQVTGEVMGDNHYRINATFISERDPIKNVKVDATSTVIAVSQIGLKGGIFQYTNALKPSGCGKILQASSEFKTLKDVVGKGGNIQEDFDICNYWIQVRNSGVSNALSRLIH
ncbi:hypothetical protein ANCDUO_13889 [Ancylostoma duodenale]|uniref:Transthyretin-like family protein n=1 Tax=Ancylostoma duodenale TaxID=51022 RepID=A0A0C2G4P2_9BILA|nr:hypothetical protein ANCDUO_13889 [Ancylostoma duodenale]